MNHINANDQPDVVKQFLLSIDVESGGTVVEIGDRVLHVSEHDPALIASIQQSYNQRASGRPLDEVAAAIRHELGSQHQ